MSKREAALVQEIYDEVNAVLKTEMDKHKASSSGFKALRNFAYALDATESERLDNIKEAEPGETSNWVVVFANRPSGMFKLSGKHHTWFYAKTYAEKHFTHYGEIESVRAQSPGETTEALLENPELAD